MTSLLDYSLITKFNELYYKGIFFHSNISDDELYIEKAKDEIGTELELQECFFPMKKNNINYLLPAKYIKELPIQVTKKMKVSFKNKVYQMIQTCEPKGFGAIKTFPSYREYIKSWCDFEHENPQDFLLWKIIFDMSTRKRMNIRVSSPPAFGKDGIIKVRQALEGNIGIVHNPTLAKIEYLLTNRVLVTNEVADIKAEDAANLQHYYLTCGDFSPIYEKRSLALRQGVYNTYNIEKLSNIVCYNDIDCYPMGKRDKYFDNVFQRAVLERFLPFRFRGKILENFGAVTNADQTVRDNIDFYKDLIKMSKWLEDNFESELHGYTPIPYKFKDRWQKNWETICLGIDAYSKDQAEYNMLCEALFERFKDYQKMISDKQEKVSTFQKYEDFKVPEEVVE